MFLVFRENAKNRQNHGVFEAAVMGIRFFRVVIFVMNGILQISGFINKKK